MECWCAEVKSVFYLETMTMQISIRLTEKNGCCGKACFFSVGAIW